MIADQDTEAAPVSKISRAREARRRNARGHGSQLAGEIVSGALAIIERTGSSEAVTLRAVAREIGIAAPSIYAHFPDRSAVVTAAVARIFDELRDTIAAAIPEDDDPVERLIAGCSAYVRFGLSNPARYGVLFSQERIADVQLCRPVPMGPDGRPVLEFGAEAFALLVDALEACVTSGASSSIDVVADGTAIWVAMHGVITLRTALPMFPWPPVDDLVHHIVVSLARIG
jgi:AcrR family transcriptional regulator